jgi:hypothetical protein
VISSFRIFINAQNAVTLKKYGGFSSELPGGSVTNGGVTYSSPTSAGIEYGTYPTTRVFAFGVNLGL